MRLCVTFCMLWLSWLALAEATDPKVVCYSGSWAVYRSGNGQLEISDIDPTLCTHLIYSFVGITLTGEVTHLDAWCDLADGGGKDGFKKFNALREKSPETKTLLAIGGWNEGSAKYSAVAADASLRSKFVTNVVDFVLLHGFDGFDVDWEYPAQRDGSAQDVQNYVLLLKELREALDQEGLILSAAVAAAESSAGLSYDIAEISKYLHFINIMTYDFHGSWETATAHNAPLYAAARETSADDLKLNVNATVHYWLKQGAPAEKLVVGTGFYGRSYALTDSSRNVPGSPSSGAGEPGPYTKESGMLGYNEICEYGVQGYWTSTAWDEEQRVAYASSGNQWVSYDNVKSITEKAEYIKSLGLGGAMVWSIETDDFRGICGEKWPLLKALNSVLRGDAVSANLPSETSAKPEEEATTPGSVSPSDAITEAAANPEANNIEEESDSDDLIQNDDDQGSNIVCTEVGFVKDPQDCAKFWYCQPNGDIFVPLPLTCPNGLYFDPTVDVCNYPSLVDC